MSLSLVVVSAFAFVNIAGAQSFKSGQTVTVASDKTIDSMLFAAGSNIDIAGKVNGDVYCAGQSVTISGTVQGDVFCAGQTITVTGTINGDARLAGQNVVLSGKVSGSASIASQSFIATENSVIGRDLLGSSQDMTIDGVIKRDFVSAANNLTVNGQVGRDINGAVNDLSVGSTGRIGGDVNYTSSNKLSISDGGKIVGTIKQTVPKTQERQISFFNPIAFTISIFVYLLIATLLFSLLIAGLLPHTLDEAAQVAIRKPGKTVLVGLVAMILAPILIGIVFITIIGIPIALLATLSWIIVMMLCMPFAAYLLGRLILPKTRNAIGIILLGTAILTITYFIPFVGFITMIATYLFGTGMILLHGKRMHAKLATQKA